MTQKQGYGKLLFIYCIIFLIQYILLRATFAGKGVGVQGENYGDGILYLLLDGIMLYLIVRYAFLQKTKWPSVIVASMIFVILQYLSLFSASHSMEFIMRLFSWFLILLGIYSFLRVKPYQLQLSNLFAYGLIFLSVYTIQSEVTIRQLAYESGLNEIYWVELGLPFAFLVKNKKLRWGLIISIGIAVLLSMKATAILVYVLAVLSGQILQIKCEKRNTSSRFIYLLVIMLGLVLLWPIISDLLLDKLGISWAAKYEESIDTGGSGRMAIWVKVFDLLSCSNATELFFGHGHDSVFKAIGFSAHNDFLEIFYDYGLFVFFVYLIFCMQLIRKLVRMIKVRSVYAPAMGMSLMIFFVASINTHLIIYPGLLMNLAAVWAICMSSDEVYSDTIIQR